MKEKSANTKRPKPRTGKVTITCTCRKVPAFDGGYYWENVFKITPQRMNRKDVNGAMRITGHKLIGLSGLEG